MFSLCSRRIVRNHFKHSVELVDGEGDIVDVLAAVEDFLLAQHIPGRETAMAERAHSAEPRDPDSRGQRRAMTTITMRQTNGAFLVTARI